MTDKYILENKEAKPVYDIKEWAKWYETNDRIVQRTQIQGIEVSTVFLGMDHRFGKGEPLLYETMIFGGEHDQYQQRYSTWDEALKGHQLACEMVVT